MHPTPFACSAVSLRQTLPKARFLASDDIVAGSAASDWRACRAGDVFFALTTADDDGHERAAEAIERGAVAVVAERLLPVEVPQALVPDSRVALARVCQALAGNPSAELRAVGVAGSAGKTVTAMLLASVFEAAGEAVGVMSSLGHSDSIEQQPPTSPTPSAPEFATWLARMQVAECKSAVLEFSQRALAERRTSGIQLDAAILTNIHSPADRESATRHAIEKTTARFFRQRKAGGLVILNTDDHRCRRLLTEISGPCLTYAIHSEADITARILERHSSEQTFLLCAGADTAPVRTRIIGDPHISNCLAAAATGLASGLDLETIARGLEAVERVPGRMERLECGQPYSVFVDAADAPEKLALAIKSIRQVTRGRVFVVFGPRGDSDPARHALLGRVIERGAHVAILTSREPGQKHQPQATHDLLDGFQRPQTAHMIPNRKTAVEFALAQAGPGDAVLVAGRGAQEPLDDREVACQWLYGHAQQPTPRHRFRVIG
jgi:UDP-N-acetylmuramoyl-L-alanyl-D-glutamate--2,6-diaminopimelate ligase